LKELNALQTVKPRVEDIVALALEEIAYDPNLAEMPDDDMEDSDDDAKFTDDDQFDNDYADDEDTSWKVRRAACLLVVALVEAFPDLSALLYERCHAPLLARFREREESVKMDVFDAYTALVRVRGAAAASSDGGAELKALAGDAEADSAVLLRQLRVTRSPRLKVRIYGVLRALLAAAGGGGYRGTAVVATARDSLEESGAPNTLKIEVLQFLRLAFCPDAAAELLPEVPPLVPRLTVAMEDRYFKVVSEAVGVAERLGAMCAAGKGGEEAAQTLFEAVLQTLDGKDLDQEVKESAIRCARYLATSPTSAATDSRACIALTIVGAQRVVLWLAGICLECA
jgi:cullin-associated NEDD8-dissociated protein 1